MNDILSLATRLRSIDDAALISALQSRTFAPGGVKDFFDLAETLLESSSVQQALSRLDRSTLGWAVAAFAVVILVNYGASYVQETIVGKVAEHVLYDMRRAMFEHLQRVSLSFMDKTEVGRLMSRLQGDVNSMQEFLETSVVSVSDLVVLLILSSQGVGAPWAARSEG